MKTKALLILIIAASVFAGCKKEKDSGTVTINLKYSVDGVLLEFDTMKYNNQAGNHYSVTRLEYYLSNITFYKSDGSFFKTDLIQYVNARTSSTNQMVFNDIPNGNYTGITFNIGIDSAHNYTYSLPTTTENNNMLWPEPMGGGYHFMKLEGYFEDAGSTPGFATHIGTNHCLVNINHPENFSVKGNDNNLTLTMNINEWYKNPETYDFNTDGGYSMGNMMAMMKIVRNGSDVFNQ
ncbi:MAG: hypothetical protein JSS90_11065 [Bacteroidetes bacterium]|jgi:hypothetical protein|nr:hypothetical protein [Bacteroidota bacterium]